MKKVFLIIFSSFLILQFVWGFDFKETELESEDSLLKLYEKWRRQYSVERLPEEMEPRFNVFKDTVKYVHSTMTVPYNLKLNNFADWTFEEFFNMYGNCYGNDGEQLESGSSGQVTSENATPLPDSFDWRTKGAVTSVKNQMHCGKSKNK